MRQGERGDNFPYCLLRRAWAVEGHVMSSKHKHREANPADYGFETDVGLVSTGVCIAPHVQPT
eukprot:7369192-Alexandrium_andersonii.AAC.1